ncbi:MAG TPA: DUF4391 domain-containing protein [Oscillospiraceae bacterium]|nr:DUF4391 domain-containing protein [Oscillospiraceae bacterium]
MLFAYPESTRVGRPLPKNTIYKNVAPTAKQRELLTQQIEKITWAHKLAPDTLNIQASTDLPEIQVFQLRLKPDVAEVHESLLAYLDKAIPSNLIFEVHSVQGIQTIACLKQFNQNGSVKCSPYLYGAVQPVDAERQALPISRDFNHLHQQLLATLLPYPLQAGESLNAAIERTEKINKLEKTIQQLNTQLLNKSMQFNRRVELNTQLKSAQQEKIALLNV